MNWYELKSRCIDHVARELARTEAGHNSLPMAERLDRWRAAQKAAEPEAAEKIKAMNGLELLDLISEVAGED
jgi:hypothetical protein